MSDLPTTSDEWRALLAAGPVEALMRVHVALEGFDDDVGVVVLRIEFPDNDGDLNTFWVRSACIHSILPRPLQVGDWVTVVTSPRSNCARIIAIDGDAAWLSDQQGTRGTALLTDLTRIPAPAQEGGE